MNNLSSEILVQNQFLSELEEWDERDVYKYKQKVFGNIVHGYFQMLTGFFFLMIPGVLVMSVFLAFCGATESIVDKIVQLVSLAVTLVLLFIVFKKQGVKRTRRFIAENHGEVGHYGYPFQKSVVINQWVSLAIFIAFVGWTAYDALSSSTFSYFLANIATTLHFSLFPFASFAFFCGCNAGMDGYDICPVCKRKGTLVDATVKRYGDRYEGQSRSSSTSRRHTADEVTTTRWSDGSTTTSTRPIYSNVTTVTVYDEHTVLEDYELCCTECTFHVTSTNEHSYRKEVGRYEY